MRKLLHITKNGRMAMVGLCLLCMSLALTPCLQTNAAAKLKLSYNGKKVTYSGKQVSKVTADGKKIGLNGTKGILLNGSAMISYKDVFKLGLKAKCSYSSSKKSLTISQNGISVVMTVGSKTAYVNGKKKKMPVAPVSVRYRIKKKTKILIPARFVATNLGYSYTWNSSQGSIALVSPNLIKYNGNWNIYKKQMGTVVANGFPVSSSIPAVTIDGSVMVSAKYAFGSLTGYTYTYDSTSKQITLQSPDTELVMTIGKKEAQINANAVSLRAAPWVVKFKNTGKSYVMVPASFVSKNMNCQYTWDKELRVAQIQALNYFQWDANNSGYDESKYRNKLTQCVGQYDKTTKGISITLTGSVAGGFVDMLETKDYENGQVHFDFPFTFNDVGERVYEKLSPILQKVSLSQITEEMARLSLSLSSLDAYEFTVQDNVLSINVHASNMGQYSIQFLKPQGVEFASLQNEDLYEKNTFTITLPGNHVDYYKNNPIQSNNPVIRSIGVALSPTGMETVVTVVTTKLQGYKIFDYGNYVRVSVGDPKDIHPNIVILDAGHGGKDSGATSNSVFEKDLNLTILYGYAQKYFNAPNSPVKAYWTRKDDTFVELYDRAGYASSIGADLFVSLHMNSFTTGKPTGTEVYYSTSNNTTLPSGLNSKTMATIYKNNIVNGFGMVDRGVQAQKYVVVHSNTVPAVLIELGFISNASDLKKLTDPTFQDNAAKIIYDSTVEIFRKYPTGR